MEGDMDIRPTTPTIPAAAPTPEAKPPRAVERNLQGASGAAAEAVQAPQIVHTHAELAFDETINRVVGRIVNEQTGETILEMPPAQLKALYTKMREQLGPLVDGAA
jgi:uncharacterized FlaG/YvyC family protein